MIVVFPISLNDQELALKNVRWWQQLGGCKGHDCLFVPDGRCQQALPILEELKKCFDNVYVFPGRAEIDGWPEGANYMFRTATAWMANSPKWKSFMWMEPDAIPLCENWLNIIGTAYNGCGKPFMGDRVQVETIPLHMSGIGIYPNPLHAYAGEAYRAHDTAWDMAAKDQIVPRAHFTKLIEHAWKHPSFSNENELTTQIRPEAVLFHASKDGSLIDLLQSKRRGKHLSESGALAQPVTPEKEPDEPGSPSPGFSSFPKDFTCDIFIRTYPADYKWLMHCLHSIQKFCTGFRKVTVVSPEDNPFSSLLGSIAMPFTVPSVEWKVMNDESPDGYLAQQITKLYADVITDYQPDMILHVDSDVVFNRPCTPNDFVLQGNPIWFYTPYSAIQTPWQPITEKFMNSTVEFEFMRRFPIMIPRWVYPRVREFCHQQHGVIISDYVRGQPHRAFSEFNALGAYCFKYHQDKFEFENTLNWPTMPVGCARQFHSWGGITEEVKKELDTILGGKEPTPTAGAGKVVSVGGDLSLPPGVKELKNGLWVLEGDTHISKWIEQQERLDHDQNSLPFILPLINKGDVVIDAGAFVGDHTVAYLKSVGETGEVYAFEPNPVAMQCLRHNVQAPNLYTFDNALGDIIAKVPLSPNCRNYGGSYVGNDCQDQQVEMVTLDSLWLPRASLIKFDVEGCEVKAMIGAQKMIERDHPVMVIEVNQSALHRQGNTVGQLFALLESHGYKWTIMQENCDANSPMYDIVCTHQKSPEVPDKVNGERGSIVVPSSPPPVTTRPLFDMQSAILFLKEFAETSTNHRMRVMINLSKSGLTPRNPKKKKKHAKNKVPTHQPTETLQGGGQKPIRGGKRKPGRTSQPELVQSQKE